MNIDRPLDRFPIVRTHSVEKTQEALSQINFSKPVLYPEGRVNKLDVVFNGCQLLQTSLSYITYGAPVRVLFPESKFITLVFPISGQGEVTGKGIASPLAAHHGLTMSAGMSIAAKLNANYEALILRMESNTIENKLAAIIGISIDGPVKYDPLLEFSNPSMKLLRDHFLFLVNMAGGFTASSSKLVLAEFEQALMVMFLHANQHKYSYLLEQTPSDVAPWQVRRAEEYIEANWRQAITLEDLAEITGVSARNLFRSFKQSRGYSPLEFVLKVRSRRTLEATRRGNNLD